MAATMDMETMAMVTVMGIPPVILKTNRSALNGGFID